MITAAPPLVYLLPANTSLGSACEQNGQWPLQNGLMRHTLRPQSSKSTICIPPITNRRADTPPRRRWPPPPRPSLCRAAPRSVGPGPLAARRSSARENLDQQRPRNRPPLSLASKTVAGVSSDAEAGVWPATGILQLTWCSWGVCDSIRGWMTPMYADFRILFLLTVVGFTCESKMASARPA